MIQEKFESARKFLIAMIVASMLVMAAVTGLYHWKGLQNLTNKKDPDANYYIPF